MGLYRMDYQLRVPWSPNPSGYYYWTNHYFFEASPGLDFEDARDEVVRWTIAAHNPAVQRNRFQIWDWPSGTLVQNTSSINSACEGPAATIVAINWTVLIWLLTDSGRYGYKRIRVPVGAEQVDGEQISADFIDYLTHSDANPWHGTTHQTLSDGTPVTGFRIDPLLRSWQWRHGTKRQQRIRLT